MIETLRLLRNVGQFDSVDSAATIPLNRLTLIYAENGRGKTTLAAVLRSLATGDPIPIIERRRLAAQHAPHVVIECDGGPPAAMFRDGAWNRQLPNVVIFDDTFVNENVYSGLAVEAAHRQNLHELILGARGVALNARLQPLVADIEEHNVTLRSKAALIPSAERGGLSVEEFCSLTQRADIDDAIRATERGLSAAREQDPVRNAPPFDRLSLPAFDLADIERTLRKDLATLDTAAAARVQAHLAGLGSGGEAWIAEGMRWLPQPTSTASAATCPFCGQDMASSPVMAHYRAYFSAGYADLKREIAEGLAAVNRTHAADMPAAFERSVRVAVERRQFWSRFCDLPDITVDTATIVRDWRAAREAVVSILTAKQAAPLERITLPPEVRAAVTLYDTHRGTITALSAALLEANAAIQVVKEQAAAGNPQAIASDLSRLKAVKARYTPAIAALCTDYLAEKAAKARTEHQRDEARAALDQYRTNIFPGYQTAVNLYLQRFNAGFRLGSVSPVQTRGGAACTYNVLINDVPVPVTAATAARGEPSFRNTLSSGDRSTLALAFFFASLDQDPGLGNKVVVIDDPISSLDEHRSLTTVQEIRRLAERANQVIVLSHNKPFLCRIWERADRSTRTALQVARSRAGSTIRSWDVDEDCITEHDRRHAMMRAYLANGASNNREVARSIRPLLEAFLRVACPEHFLPSTKLGQFRDLCRQRVGTPQQILDAGTTAELADLVEYSNRFHHDTNPAWETEAINDTELAGFVRRALNFAKR